MPQTITSDLIHYFLRRESRTVTALYFVGASFTLQILGALVFMITPGVHAGSDVWSWSFVSPTSVLALIAFQFHGLASFVAFVLFVSWFRDAYELLTTVAYRPARRASNWTLLGFLIPILNLYIPYQMAREIWCSLNEQWELSPEIRDRKTPARIIEAWWVTGLLIILVSMAFVVFDSGVSASPYASQSEVLWGIVLCLLGLVFVLLTVLVVRGITALYLPLLQAIANSKPGVCIAPPPKPAMSS